MHPFVVTTFFHFLYLHTLLPTNIFIIFIYFARSLSLAFPLPFISYHRNPFVFMGFIIFTATLHTLPLHFIWKAAIIVDINSIEVFVFYMSFCQSIISIYTTHYLSIYMTIYYLSMCRSLQVQFHYLHLNIEYGILKTYLLLTLST